MDRIKHQPKKNNNLTKMKQVENIQALIHKILNLKPKKNKNFICQKKINLKS